MWACNSLGYFLLKCIFHGHNLNKGMTIHWEDWTISYDDNPSKSGLEWSRKQKICTKMAIAHARPQFSVHKRMFMVLKYRETGQCSVRFKRQYPNQRTSCRHTIMENTIGMSKYGLPLHRKSVTVDIQGQHKLKLIITW